MKLETLGEFGLIQRLIELITARRMYKSHNTLGYRLVVDVGDDAAAWHCEQATELATTDTLVEGVHFTKDTIPWYDLGWKSMAVNISDIAAMGGTPIYALITLGLPGDTEVEDIDLLYSGMLDLASEYEISIVGGDVVRSPITFITASLTGTTQYSPLLRSMAKAGDLVSVTGYLGSSAGGLKIISQELTVDPETSKKLKQAHCRPRPSIYQGRILAREGVQAATDISDGLISDLHKICEASNVAAQVTSNQLPVDHHLKKAFPENYANLALSGGEDYGLIFTAPPNLTKKVLPLLPHPAVVIGELIEGNPGEIILLDHSGKSIPISEMGWNHFH